jgi:hypothetical protein
MKRFIPQKPAGWGGGLGREKRDSSLRRPTLSQEVKGEEKVGPLRSE